jgi:hypothetical protein
MAFSGVSGGAPAAWEEFVFGACARSAVVERPALKKNGKCQGYCISEHADRVEAKRKKSSKTSPKKENEAGAGVRLPHWTVLVLRR